MGITFDKQTITFEAVIYEDEVVSLREKLNELAPETIHFDMRECDDMHLAVIQQVLAYKKVYSCDYSFADEVKTYQKILEGFDENDCSF